MRKAKFIVFEGVDGSGKTTQIDRAERFLRSMDLEVARFREPGGTNVGERVRALLLDPDLKKMTAKTEVLLFFASRVQLLEEEILPAVAAGKTVLLDRYYYSTAAYQGPFMAGFGANWVCNLAEDWLRLTEPDRVIYLDGDPEELARRKSGALDRIEAKGLDYQRKVREAYLLIAGQRTDIFRTINAARTVEEVGRDVEAALKELFYGEGRWADTA